MAVSPADFEGYAQTYADVADEAERIMLRKVTKRLMRGVDEPGWAEKKLLEILQLRGDIRAQIRELRAKDPDIAHAVTQAYLQGAQIADADLGELGAASLHASAVALMPKINSGTLTTLLSATTDKLKATHLRILRSTEDGYRAVIASASSQVAAGTLTWQQATQNGLDKFADRGISGFVDAKGRSWDLSSYSEMAVRTATGQAAVQGHVDRLQAHGQDLVIVSTSGECCELCEPWEAKVLSISGKNGQYPSLADARNEGLFHPNCTHTVSIYIHGVTKIPEVIPAEKRIDNYKESQAGRKNERMIRQWKRREAVAETPEAQRQASAKVKDWQAAQREFIKRTGRRRDSWREQVRTLTDEQKATTDDRKVRKKISRAWTANSDNATSVQFKQAVREELGVGGVLWNPNSHPIDQTAVDALRRQARGVYDSTQSQLASAGVRSLTLYRGVQHEYEDVGTVESWTSNLKKTAQYAGKSGTILSGDFPAEQVLWYHEHPDWVNGRRGMQWEYILLNEVPK